jgi:single-strand DNA-binding protein
MNMLIINGFITEDIFMSRTKSGVAVANFELAHRRNKRSNVEYYRCAAYGDTAVYVNEYFKKGDLCLIEGNLTIREWTDKFGVTRNRVQIAVHDIEFNHKKDIPKDEEETEEPDCSPIYDDDSKLLSAWR